MRSLAFKLTLALILASLTGTAMAAFFTYQRTQNEFSLFLFDQGKTEMLNALATYYASTGSWKDVDKEIRLYRVEDLPQGTPQQGVNPARPFPARRPPFTLTDEAGRVIYGNPALAGKKIDPKADGGQAIEVDGKIVGWLVASRQMDPWEAETPEAAFISGVYRNILLSALIGIAIALLLGGLLVQTLTNPLRELTQATQIIAQGELGYQVDVRSADELGRLALSFNQMSSDLAKSNELRRQMTADVAHDLRTPLSVILGYTEALSDGKLQGGPEIYETLHQEARQLNRLIDDLRTLSLADAGELSLNLVPVSPTALLQRIAATYRHKASEKQVALSVEAGAELPALQADPERLAQVLGNLISNALRYTPEGGSIQCRAAREGEEIVIEVQDSGSGIAAEDLPHIFNRFYRGSKSRQANGEAGLGLAIARSLVQAQGGQIHASSEPGLGATFTIRLPVSQAS